MVLALTSVRAKFCPGDQLFQYAIANNCTRVGGDLVITNMRSALLTLELTGVDGSLIVAANPALESVTGLRVNRVGGDVHVHGNWALVSFADLGLTSVGGGVHVSSNPMLNNVSALCTAAIAGSVSVTFGSLSVDSMYFCAYERAPDKAALEARIDTWVADPVGAKGLYGEISMWDVSLVTDMESLFGRDMESLYDFSHALGGFNEDISRWNVASVTNMQVSSCTGHQCPCNHTCLIKHGQRWSGVCDAV